MIRAYSCEWYTFVSFHMGFMAKPFNHRASSKNVHASPCLFLLLFTLNSTDILILLDHVPCDVNMIFMIPGNMRNGVSRCRVRSGDIYTVVECHSCNLPDSDCPASYRASKSVLF